MVNARPVVSRSIKPVKEKTDTLCRMNNYTVVIAGGLESSKRGAVRHNPELSIIMLRALEKKTGRKFSPGW